jgi:hypothetical protein
MIVSSSFNTAGQQHISPLFQSGKKWDVAACTSSFLHTIDSTMRLCIRPMGGQIIGNLIYLLC